LYQSKINLKRGTRSKMAARTKNSDEQPIRSNSTEPPSPRVDPATTADDEAEERNTANEDPGDLENNEEEIWKAEKAGEGYFVPLRIWCASVIFPLCAGSFGPMSSAFGICALAGSWRVQNLTQAPDNMMVGTDIKDPAW
jgi:potassium channel subfamily K